MAKDGGGRSCPKLANKSKGSGDGSKRSSRRIVSMDEGVKEVVLKNDSSKRRSEKDLGRRESSGQYRDNRDRDRQRDREKESEMEKEGRDRKSKRGNRVGTEKGIESERRKEIENGIENMTGRVTSRAGFGLVASAPRRHVKLAVHWRRLGVVRRTLGHCAARISHTTVPASAMPICPMSSDSSSPGSAGRAWIFHGLVVSAAAVVAYLYRWPGGFRSHAVGIIPMRFASSSRRNCSAPSSASPWYRTWERVMLASSLDHVVVATDDERIAECCRRFGADVIMILKSCRNGSERCCEALQKLKKHYDIVVNIQGDEPLIEPEIIDGVVMALQRAPDAVFSTAVTSLKPEDASDTNRVKCVLDNQGYAIYFSGGLIPFNKSGQANPQFPYLLHLGISGFDSKFLKIYPELPPTPLQLENDLEQLKVLENGNRMKVIKVGHDAHGVDAPEDVEKIEALMRAKNIQ
ncbi:hypothetical protein ABZP36_014106 [Zizania latifolia]